MYAEIKKYYPGFVDVENKEKNISFVFNMHHAQSIANLKAGRRLHWKTEGGGGRSLGYDGSYLLYTITMVDPQTRQIRFSRVGNVWQCEMHVTGLTHRKYNYEIIRSLSRFIVVSYFKSLFKYFRLKLRE